MDETNSIKFTPEDECDGAIPFLDTLITRKPDGSIKLLVYRKKTHTDQYLKFFSHHPLQHKLSVVRTLLDRCFNLVSEEKDRQAEEKHIKDALSHCGYPPWSIKRVKNDIMKKKDQECTNKRKKKKSENENKSKGMVVIPYIKGLSEAVSRVFKKHRVSTAMRPFQTIKNMIVHPKDKQSTSEKAEIIYKILCKNCEQVYIRESGRKFGIRLGEHKKDCECNVKSAYTRATRKLSETTMEKSAITDHQNVNNHEIDWEGAKIFERESDWRMRKTKEAIRIRTEGAVMNRDQGTFLSGIYDPLFASLRKTGGKSRGSEPRVRSFHASSSDEVLSAGRKVLQN